MSGCFCCAWMSFSIHDDNASSWLFQVCRSRYWYYMLLFKRRSALMSSQPKHPWFTDWFLKHSALRCFERVIRIWSSALRSKTWCIPSPRRWGSCSRNHLHNGRSTAGQCRKSTSWRLGNQGSFLCWLAAAIVASCPYFIIY